MWDSVYRSNGPGDGVAPAAGYQNGRGMKRFSVRKVNGELWVRSNRLSGAGHVQGRSQNNAFVFNVVASLAVLLPFN